MHSYLCVGYSVIQYHLDGERIGALQGHQGSSAGVEVIATFLPASSSIRWSTALGTLVWTCSPDLGTHRRHACGGSPPCAC